jgi:hypothetical protein
MAAWPAVTNPHHTSRADNKHFTTLTTPPFDFMSLIVIIFTVTFYKKMVVLRKCVCNLILLKQAGSSWCIRFPCGAGETILSCDRGSYEPGEVRGLPPTLHLRRWRELHPSALLVPEHGGSSQNLNCGTALADTGAQIYVGQQVNGGHRDTQFVGQFIFRIRSQRHFLAGKIECVKGAARLTAVKTDGLLDGRRKSFRYSP